MATGGKPAGVAGPFVAGDATVIEWLQQRGRTAIFTTAHPPAVSCAVLESLRLIAAADHRPAHLRGLIQKLRRAVTALDAATGEQLWVFGLNEGARGAGAPRQGSGRGLAFWRRGDDKRVV